MTSKDQINEFIIDMAKRIAEIIKMDKLIEDESKELTEDWMKETFIDYVEELELRNTGIKKIKFTKNLILKGVSLEEISLEDIVINIQELNLPEFLNSYNLENLFGKYAISAGKFFQDKQKIKYIVDLIKENLARFEFDNDREKF